MLSTVLLGAALAWPASPPVDARAAGQPHPDLQEIVQRVARHVERMRGVSFGRPPMALAAEAAAVRRAAAARASPWSDGIDLQARGRAWADLGLADAGAPAAWLAAWARDLGGIALDASRGRLLFDVASRPSAGRLTGDPEESSTLLWMAGVRPDEPPLAHLLVHGLQAERAGGAPAPRTTDGWLAAAAWSEGEAHLVALRYLFGGMDLADEVLDPRLDPGDFLDGRLLPEGLLRERGTVGSMLRFVHLDGFAAAAKIFREAGWSGLDREMKRRRTTRDLMHLDRPPLVAEDARPATPPAPGLELADEDSIGEWGVVLLISALTGKDDLALRAAEGWSGDRLQRWEPADGTGSLERSHTVWLSRWETEAAAGAFAYAAERGFETRHGASGAGRGSDPRRILLPDGRRLGVSRAGSTVRVEIGPASL